MKAAFGDSGPSGSRSEALDTTIVVASVFLFLISGFLFVSLMMPIHLPYSISSRVADLSLRLLKILPRRVASRLIEALSWVSLLSLMVGCCLSLVSGLRALRQAGPTWRRIMLTSCGAMLATTLCAGPLAFHSYQRALLNHAQDASQATVAELQHRLEEGSVPSRHRQLLWKLYAQSVYWHQGVAVEIPDERGGKILYEPTESEIAARKTYLELIGGFQSPYGFTVFAVGFVAMSVLLGMMTPASTKPPRWPVGGAGTDNGMKPAEGGGLESA